MKLNDDNILSWGGGKYQSFSSSLKQHLWETFKFHTFLWLKPCSCPKVSLQYKLHDVAVWSRYAHSPICQQFTHTCTHTHTYKSVDFSSLHVVRCTLWKWLGWHGYRCTCTCTHTQLHVKACYCCGFGASRACGRSGQGCSYRKRIREFRDTKNILF